MDENLLETWKQNFFQALPALKVEYDAYFLPVSLSAAYRLETAANGTLSLKIDHGVLPAHIEERLKDLFAKAKPF